ncbi:hypothetical protein BKK79_00665 [Cupriavidus sp. USMAA2-4]|uniref:DUF2892 domain-containing protein n=1 Tax=Cupriavidus malaysiensis TaxID=367825 RepID=A0A1D9I2U5_9BURK|nr:MULTISPECIES: hypothetical protein [Cupriavidus]AOY90505.1 hypothetical protein BKK79_00665 [Cupriavidus sp. USMAA2-4]AOY99809.1 hypothetical protein BKK81_11580 [Cupriavidus sp. USMAHM13]AOZ06436.1 hypothetical protein BKK80_11850 [Cupriavidus malaysiensis]
MPTRSSAPAAQQPALSNQSPRIDTFRVLFGVGVAAILALLALDTPWLRTASPVFVGALLALAGLAAAASARSALVLLTAGCPLIAALAMVASCVRGFSG